MSLRVFTFFVACLLEGQSLYATSDHAGSAGSSSTSTPSTASENSGAQTNEDVLSSIDETEKAIDNIEKHFKDLSEQKGTDGKPLAVGVQADVETEAAMDAIISDLFLKDLKLPQSEFEKMNSLFKALEKGAGKDVQDELARNLTNLLDEESLGGEDRNRRALEKIITAKVGYYNLKKNSQDRGQLAKDIINGNKPKEVNGPGDTAKEAAGQAVAMATAQKILGPFSGLAIAAYQGLRAYNPAGLTKAKDATGNVVNDLGTSMAKGLGASISQHGATRPFEVDLFGAAPKPATKNVISFFQGPQQTTPPSTGAGDGVKQFPASGNPGSQGQSTGSATNSPQNSGTAVSSSSSSLPQTKPSSTFSGGSASSAGNTSGASSVVRAPNSPRPISSFTNVPTASLFKSPPKLGSMGSATGQQHANGTSNANDNARGINGNTESARSPSTSEGERLNIPSFSGNPVANEKVVSADTLNRQLATTTPPERIFIGSVPKPPFRLDNNFFGGSELKVGNLSDPTGLNAPKLPDVETVPQETRMAAEIAGAGVSAEASPRKRAGIASSAGGNSMTATQLAASNKTAKVGSNNVRAFRKGTTNEGVAADSPDSEPATATFTSENYEPPVAQPDTTNPKPTQRKGPPTPQQEFEQIQDYENSGMVQTPQQLAKIQELKTPIPLDGSMIRSVASPVSKELLNNSGLPLTGEVVQSDTTPALQAGILPASLNTALSTLGTSTNSVLGTSASTLFRFLTAIESATDKRNANSIVKK